jgi:hypothetical protein
MLIKDPYLQSNHKEIDIKSNPQNKYINTQQNNTSLFSNPMHS